MCNFVIFCSIFRAIFSPIFILKVIDLMLNIQVEERVRVGGNSGQQVVFLIIILFLALTKRKKVGLAS